MEHVEAVEHEYPPATARGVGETHVPDGIGGVELPDTVATAGIEGEVGADAEAVGETEVAVQAVAHVPGIDIAEILARGGGVAVGKITYKRYVLLAQLPSELDAVGDIG